MLADIKVQWAFFSRFHTVPVCILKIILYTTYTFIFARPSMQRISRGLLHLALHGVGYDNWWSFRTTGEELFFQIVARRNPATILDIGANRGAYSARLLAETKATLIAFEPQPNLFNDLLELKRRYPDRFFPVQKGVGDTNRIGRLQYSLTNTELASFCDEINQIAYVGETNDSTVDVEIVTLDSFLENFSSAPSGFDVAAVGLVKIDVEGFEVEVLRGARHFIERCRPELIQIEFNHHQLFRGHTLLSIASMLPQYNIFKLMPFGSGLARIDPSAIDSNIFSFSNFIFIRSDISQQFESGRH